MSEVLTAVLTAFFGALILVLGQVLQSLFVEPIKEHRRLIGKINFAITFYANVAAPLSTSDKIQHTSRVLRSLASRLRANVETIPFYWFFVLFGVVWRRKRVKEVSRQLIGWSNSLYDERGIESRASELRKILKIKD